MPFLSQMKIGVLDNYGIQFTAKNFSNKNSNKTYKMQQVKNFLALKTQLINHDLRVKHLTLDKVGSLIGELSCLLSTSDKPIQITFLYPN